jgi:hypothetical protein
VAGVVSQLNPALASNISSLSASFSAMTFSFGPPDTLTPTNAYFSFVERSAGGAQVRRKSRFEPATVVAAPVVTFGQGQRSDFTITWDQGTSAVFSYSFFSQRGVFNFGPDFFTMQPQTLKVVTTLRNWKRQDPSNTLSFLMEYDSSATALNESDTLSGVWDFYQFDTPAGLAACQFLKHVLVDGSNNKVSIATTSEVNPSGSKAVVVPLPPFASEVQIDPSFAILLGGSRGGIGSSGGSSTTTIIVATVICGIVFLVVIGIIVLYVVADAAGFSDKLPFAKNRGQTFGSGSR